MVWADAASVYVCGVCWSWFWQFLHSNNSAMVVAMSALCWGLFPSCTVSAVSYLRAVAHARQSFNRLLPGEAERLHLVIRCISAKGANGPPGKTVQQHRVRLVCGGWCCMFEGLCLCWCGPASWAKLCLRKPSATRLWVGSEILSMFIFMPCTIFDTHASLLGIMCGCHSEACVGCW